MTYNDKFDYVYRMDEPTDDGWSPRDIAEAILALASMAICVVAVMMLFLCG